MVIKRVFIDTQSNELFRGFEGEQNYDQRALCQAGRGDVLVITNPIDPEYLAYWSGLGFDLPTIIHAGPFEPSQTLSDHVCDKKVVMDKILEAIGDSDARLEFFWVSERERRLADFLQVPPYCNFDVSIGLASKVSFKHLCEEIGLQTAPWIGVDSVEEIPYRWQGRFPSCDPVLIKASNGTGGKSLGTICRLESFLDLQDRQSELGKLSAPLVVEKILDVSSEVSIHWEMTMGGEMIIHGIFDQLTNDFSYAGTAFPTVLSPELQVVIRESLANVLMPYLQQAEASGFFCCDLLIDRSGVVHWTDFNPRKGAIVYIHDCMRRLTQIHFPGRDVYCWHEHSCLKAGSAFDDVRQCLGRSLAVSEETPFVVITNPGIIAHGGLDITGVSLQSRGLAKEAVELAKRKIA